MAGYIVYYVPTILHSPMINVYAYIVGLGSDDLVGNHINFHTKRPEFKSRFALRKFIKSSSTICQSLARCMVALLYNQ